ncbi:anthranilate phosphoribosyltransferase [Ectobacillus ponti]|uniref:Anthranilate phosphoribosyltransferase n=1 Tax=Ectobacillus ponti TaxID=2961894 RepID=A0AA41X8K8_9BACI|nr:anthranilate phosphoribosyltransferase [Ectobacillus ponti]MCP8968370.1 anthranilate phosphoribosyltransferase [Ectobacillus ponti]
MNAYLRKLIERQALTEQEVYEAGISMFEGSVSDSQIAAFLVGLKTKGETPDEIFGLVRAMRDKAVPFSKSIAGAMDNCGTGGDGAQTFNISTTTAFVLAGAGVKVAKHGNRSVSSKSGSADVLERLGINITCPPEQVEQLLETVGIAFLFAPSVHPAMKRVMHIRKELNIPTIFNMIGPLTNPVELETQLVGIYKREMLVPVAEVLYKIGRKRAVVLNGSGHLDEASLQGENYIALLEDGKIHEMTLHPADYGFEVVPNSAIRGGGPEENARILTNILQGETGPFRDTVVLNAALGLFANGKARTVEHGIQLAKESIDSGKALHKLRLLAEESNRLKEVAQ